MRGAPLRRIPGLLGSALFFAALSGAAWAASSDGGYMPPDFSGLWSRTGNIRGSFDPVPGDTGAGPVMIDPRYPRQRPREGAGAGVVAVVQGWVPDLSNPILQPRTREALAAIAENELNDVPHPQNQTRCMPPGVPHILNLFDPMQVLQTPTEVLFLYSRDHHVRHVFLNRPHGENIGHSWWGESVGHYEGDTLVVDTIGLNDKTESDRFGTPHSDRIHVVERYRLSGDGRVLEIVFTVEDHVAFTMPWSARSDYARDDWLFVETVCAENQREFWPGRTIELPVDETPDF